MEKLKIGEEPHEVTWVKLMATAGIPIGVSAYTSIIEKYPEHFPEETERRKRWNSVPEEVMDAYKRESSEAYDEATKDLPVGKGILYWINHQEEYDVWRQQFRIAREKYDVKEKEIYEKYLSPYGL